MTQPASPLWTTGLSDVRKTGTWRDEVPEYQTAPSPCHGACPVNHDIARWMYQIREGDYPRRLADLDEQQPLPAIAGRICHHPCECLQS